MKEFELLEFDYAKCIEQTSEFGELLRTNEVLSESRDILPFFKERKHLSAFLGSYAGGINNFDKYAHEFSVFDDFRADLVVGDSRTNEYFFIEFEDAKQNSIFERNGEKVTLEWSKRFEHGYSQLVDWFWKLDDMGKTTEFKSKFGSELTNYHGMLVIGRDKFLDYRGRVRLDWRRNKVLVNSKSIICVTYDELFRQIDSRLDLYRKIYASGFEID